MNDLSTDLAQSQQEANELGANPSSPALDPIALSSGSVVAAGAISPGPRRKSWSKARNMRAEERLRIMREAIDRG